MKRKGETSYKETAFGILPRAKLIPLEIEGIKRAWDFVLKQEAKGKISVTSSSLQKIHAVGFGWIFPEMGGKFRTIEVTVSKHTFFDYNGRIGRLLISMILMNLGLPPVELRVETKLGRIKYVKALSEADEGNFVALEKLIRAALEEAAKNLS